VIAQTIAHRRVDRRQCVGVEAGVAEQMKDRIRGLCREKFPLGICPSILLCRGDV